jgi:hypothetical protein
MGYGFIACIPAALSRDDLYGWILGINKTTTYNVISTGTAGA